MPGRARSGCEGSRCWRKMSLVSGSDTATTMRLMPGEKNASLRMTGLSWLDRSEVDDGAGTAEHGSIEPWGGERQVDAGTEAVDQPLRDAAGAETAARERTGERSGCVGGPTPRDDREHGVLEAGGLGGGGDRCRDGGLGRFRGG